MCTVIVRVPEDPAVPMRLLAIRDEDPNRPWHPLGAWWPDEHPGVVGVHDVRAGGAWLAADPATTRLAVLLNRADTSPLADDAVLSRGTLPLASVEGALGDGAPPTRGFNLLEVGPEGSRVVSWDGESLNAVPLAPGTHMIAHDDLDDPRTARITTWLPRFAEVPEPQADDAWWDAWLAILAESAALAATDDRALIRDHRHLGIPTLSLMVAVASVGGAAAELDVRDATLPAPGVWGRIGF